MQTNAEFVAKYVLVAMACFEDKTNGVFFCFFGPGRLSRSKAPQDAKSIVLPFVVTAVRRTDARFLFLSTSSSQPSAGRNKPFLFVVTSSQRTDIDEGLHLLRYWSRTGMIMNQCAGQRWTLFSCMVESKAVAHLSVTSSQ